MDHKNSLRCDKCGSEYRGDAIKRLSYDDSLMERKDDGIYRAVACLCDTDSYNRAGSFGLRQKIAENDQFVLVKCFGSSRYRSGSGFGLGKPIRRTKTRIFITIYNEIHCFNAETGREVGSSCYLLYKDELEIALGIVEKATAA